VSELAALTTLGTSCHELPLLDLRGLTAVQKVTIRLGNRGHKGPLNVAGLAELGSLRLWYLHAEDDQEDGDLLASERSVVSLIAELERRGVV
jgi:hypothetical protein